MKICKGCRKPISGNVVNAMGKHWHPHCLLCKSCRQPLQGGSFVVFRKKLYHSQCVRCPGCKKPISAEYVEHNKMPWHPACIPTRGNKKCSVCRKPLTRRYFVDFWGNPYCDQHQNHPECSSCGRLVCDNLTDGAMQYPDGVVICNQCSLNGVSTQAQADQIAEEMRFALASVGLKLNSTQTPVFLCGRDELNGASHHNFHDNHPILGVTRTNTTHSRGEILARNFDCILIQINLPEEHFRTVMIHELTHAWFFYNYFLDLPLKVEEGMCVLMEYIWLKNLDTKDAEFRRKQIALTPDPIYGDGFREAREALRLMPLSKLLSYIKEKKKFPTRWAAFFY
ncbi:protein DA1 [Endozoicomonas ascidiicola]|uniref:protein DA1 n=2 Tax=Endozoicomonas ascidiicola TaxID=1698521 RepID=UPI00264954CA|nr:protein DA1 [Endozoicomonas ascidiicola]